MKKILVLVAGLLLFGLSVYAADGDLIVNGNLGVGTSTPQAKLHVAGSIKADAGTVLYTCPAIDYGCGTGCIGQLSVSSACSYGTGYNNFFTGDFVCSGSAAASCTAVGRLLVQ